MNWFSVIDRVVSKDKDYSQEEEEEEVCTWDESEDAISEEFAPPEGSLSRLERDGLLCVMHYLSLQLRILQATSPGSAAGPRSNETSARKLHEITEETKTELAESGTFRRLCATAKEEMTKRKANSEIEKRMCESEKKMKHLRLQIRSNDIVRVKEMNKKQEMIASLKDEIQNLVAESESRTRYVDRSENARQGANRRRCDNVESAARVELERLRATCDDEIKVNDRMCAFLAEEIEKLEADAESWKERYNAEMTRRRDKIKRLHEKAEEQEFRIKELKRLDEMNEYLKFKEEKRLEEERNRFVCESATKIQAWWRGTMVRRGLGPYKRRKKCVKDKKKKDK